MAYRLRSKTSVRASEAQSKSRRVVLRQYAYSGAFKAFSAIPIEAKAFVSWKTVNSNLHKQIAALLGRPVIVESAAWLQKCGRFAYGRALPK